jgi:organic radical activating enzyme
VDIHKRKPKSIEKVLKEIDSFENNSSVTLSGGEPGMLSESDLNIIIKKLQDKNIIIDLVTNGLFLEKHQKYIHYIDEILYHCIEDLSQHKPIKKYNYKNFYYVMVITNSDLYYMDDILWYFKQYPEIKFLLFPNIKPGERININKFLKLLKDYSNNINRRTKSEFIKNIL